MDNFIDERDYKLLENDECTFFVLRRIIDGKCELLLTDHERLIICFTAQPFPVWIWTPDDASEEEMERAYERLCELSLLDGEHHFNLKYNLAEFFIKKSQKEGKSLSVSMNMLAYTCENPNEPKVKADGGIHRCSRDDIEDLLNFIISFQNEVGIDKRDREVCRANAEHFIDSGRMFLWKDSSGKSVASCKFEPNGTMASVNLVFTHPEFRRKHYAENLVYRVTKIAADEGYLPMLYTNADYAASNACYEKIGYTLKGKLCRIGYMGD